MSSAVELRWLIKLTDVLFLWYLCLFSIFQTKL